MRVWASGTVPFEVWIASLVDERGAQVWVQGTFASEGEAIRAAETERAHIDDAQAQLTRAAQADTGWLAEIDRLRGIERAARAFVVAWDNDAIGDEYEPRHGIDALAVALGERPPVVVTGDRGDETCAAADSDPEVAARTILRPQVGELRHPVKDRLRTVVLARLVEMRLEWGRLEAGGGLDRGTFLAAKHMRDSDLSELIAAIGGAL